MFFSPTILDFMTIEKDSKKNDPAIPIDNKILPHQHENHSFDLGADLHKEIRKKSLLRKQQDLQAKPQQP